MNRQRNFKVKEVLKHCFITLLVLVFSWQQYSVFGYTSTENNYSNTSVSPLKSDNLWLNAQIASDFPVNSPPAEPVAEVIEEDETKLHLSKYWSQLADKFSASELFYTASLNSRLLQITSSLYSRISIPFFILHHSWKSFLS